MTMYDDWVIEARHADDTRYFDADALPIVIGGDSSADIRLHGVAGSVQIGLLDATFFVQPGRETRGMRVDGELVKGTRSLRGGEIIALDSARLACRLDDSRLRIAVEGHLTGSDTAPPDLADLAREADEVDALEIKPIAFRPVEDAPKEIVARPRPATVAVGAAFALLAVLGWFAFTAKSVEITVTPAPDALALPDTIFKLRLTDRYLLRSVSSG